MRALPAPEWEIVTPSTRELTDLLPQIKGVHQRQVTLYGDRSMSGNALTSAERATVLAAHVGEICDAALLDPDTDVLYDELLQVTACTLAWLVRLEREDRS